MEQAVPAVFSQIDGFSSHSYPNPGFAQAPSRNSASSISSFEFEQQLIEKFSGRTLPVFITETGWSQNAIPDEKISSYYKQAFNSIWNVNSIVVVTPFLLRALQGPFVAFSLLRDGGVQTLQYKTIAELPKIKGLPVFSKETITATIHNSISPLKDFSREKLATSEAFSIPHAICIFYKWLLKI
jgi:hypothetical protein